MERVSRAPGSRNCSFKLNAPGCGVSMHLILQRSNFGFCCHQILYAAVVHTLLCWFICCLCIPDKRKAKLFHYKWILRSFGCWAKSFLSYLHSVSSRVGFFFFVCVCVVPLQLLWWEAYNPVCFVPADLEKQRCSSSWGSLSRGELGWPVGLLLQWKRSQLFAILLMLEVYFAQWHSELQLALVLRCWCAVQLNAAWI